MPYLDITWDLDDDPAGNVQHIAQNGLNKDDVRWVLENPLRQEASRSSGRPLVFGYTPDDVFIVVVYEQIDEHTVYPVTAYLRGCRLGALSMANQGRDLRRKGRLTAVQAARYEKVRRQVMAEIPPLEDNVVSQTIGKLRQLRQDQGLSLAQLQKRTGMTRANLCRLEKEKRNVQLRTLERYARALGCRLEIQVVPKAVKAKVSQG